MPYPSLRTSMFLILPAILLVVITLIAPLLVLLQSSLVSGDFLTGQVLVAAGLLTDVQLRAA